MYKDKEKQREVQRDWVRQKRANQQGSTAGSTGLKRGKDIKCFEDLHPEIQVSINHYSTDKDGKIDKNIKAVRTAIAINYQHLFPDRYEPHSDLEFTTLMTQADPKTKIRVSKPGDEDYDGTCTPEWIAERTA